jgi:hypothetical protein
MCCQRAQGSAWTPVHVLWAWLLPAGSVLQAINPIAGCSASHREMGWDGRQQRAGTMTAVEHACVTWPTSLCCSALVTTHRSLVCMA